MKIAGADAVVLLDDRGSVVYPLRSIAPAADPALERPSWQEAESRERDQRLIEAAALWKGLAKFEGSPDLAARATEGEIRCLVRAGRKDAALGVIQRYFSAGLATQAIDLDGRLIGADEQLLALHLLPPGNVRYMETARRLAARLNDYGGPPMLSAQRLFLMEELHTLAPQAANFPWFAAESLAEQFVEAEHVRPGDPVLERSGLAGVWRLTSPNHRVIALYRSATVASLMNSMLAEPGSSRSVRFTVIPPGVSGEGEDISAGAMLPGWQISFALLDTRPQEEAARRRTAAYVWLACAVVAATVLAGVFAGQLFRRQARLHRLKTDLLAAVSHELKTPLASMRLLLETLLEDGQPDAVKTREYLKLIAGENLRLTRLVENFLTFSRIERNRQHFDFTDTCPAAVVESAMAAMGERLQAHGCHVELEMQPGLPPILADRDALTTVLVNLLDNACKYTPAEKRIRVRAYRENGILAFDVQDNGIGISPRDRKRIFRRFYQVDRRLARETGGCGLGLSIVEFIVHAHGGEVRVESRPGAGSTFRVCLPCRQVAKQAVP
jgi:signal transduction histidine kinase